MTKNELLSEISKKKSYLCIGLDTDINKIPSHLKNSSDPVFEFNKCIIDATHPYCVAYKLNTAFYESAGLDGWKSLEKTIKYIPPQIFKIADAKRGDIANTAMHYAKSFFENFQFDAVTVIPYIGIDSVLPFLEYKNKFTILVAVTTNEGRNDFQFIKDNGLYLWEKVIINISKKSTSENLMFVIGGIDPEIFKKVRQIVPDHFLLVPGIGAQGGKLKNISQYGLNKNCGLLINSSRNIIYPSNDLNFAEHAKNEAIKIQKEMEIYLHKYCPLIFNKQS